MKRFNSLWGRALGVTICGTVLMVLHPAIGAAFMALYVVAYHQFRDMSTAPFWACCCAAIAAVNYSGMTPHVYWPFLLVVYAILTHKTLQDLEPICSEHTLV